MIFTRQQLQKMVCGGYEKGDPKGLFLLESHIIDSDDWTISYSGIFKHQDKYYQTDWNEGSTEYSDERPFEDEKELDCVEVEKKDVIVKQWVPIQE